jgi:hypothetical protein
MEELPDSEQMKAIAEAVAADWGLELGEPFALSRYSYVAPVGAEAVLKVAWAGDDESLHEAESLVVWDGDGAVRLLRSDPSRRALLQERARPGTDLSVLTEARAVAAAVDVARRLWRPAAEPFRWIGDVVPGWIDAGERDGDEGSELVPLARERTLATVVAYRGGKAPLTEVLAARRMEAEARMQGVETEREVARMWARLNFTLPEALPPTQRGSSREGSAR